MASTTGIKAGRAWVELGVDSTQLERGLRVASNQVREFGKNVQAIGQTFVKFGLLAGTPFAAGAKLFSDYESQMANVKVLSHASAEEFAVMGKKAKQLGLDTIFSAAQAAESMAVFAQAQFSVKDILEATGPAMDLAATGHIEIAQAATIATKILKGMKLEVSQLPAVIDVLAKAATTSTVDLEQLGEAFRFIGPVAKAAGVNFNEITAAIQELSDAGIPGEMSGTALRGMLISLLSPTSEASKALAAMGIQLKDGKHNFVGLASVIGQFQSKLAGMGDVDKLEAIGRIFPDRQTAAASVLIANGAAAMMEKTAKLGNAAGTAATVAAARMDTLRGATERLMSSLEGIGIALGEAITPTLRKWGDVLVEVANSIARITEKNHDFVVMVGKLVVESIAFGAALTAIGLAAKLVAFQLGVLRVGVKGLLILAKVTGAWKLLVFGFTQGVQVIKAASIALWLVVDSVVVLGQILMGASMTIVGLGSAMGALLTPANLLVIGVVALGAALYYTGAAGKVLAWLGEQFAIMADDAKYALGGIVAALKAGDVDLAAKIFWRGLDVVWRDGMLAITKLTSDWGRDLKDTMAAASGGLAMIWISVWHGIAIATKEIMADIKDAGVNLFDWLKKGARDAAGALAENRANAVAEQKKMQVNIRQRTEIEDAKAGGGDRAAKIAEINRRANQDRMNIEKERAAVFAKNAAGEGEAEKKAADAGVQRDKDRLAARIKSIETYRNEMKALFDMMDAGEGKNREVADAAIKDAENRLAVAKQQLEALVNLAKAKEKGLAPEKKPEAKNFPGPEPQPPEATTPEDLDKALQKAHVSARGTFMASEAFGLSASEEIGEKQVREQKRTNDHLTDIKKEVKKKNAPQFA